MSKNVVFTYKGLVNQFRSLIEERAREELYKAEDRIHDKIEIVALSHGIEKHDWDSSNENFKEWVERFFKDNENAKKLLIEYYEELEKEWDYFNAVYHGCKKIETDTNDDYTYKV